jgi:hypothetical protein
MTVKSRKYNTFLKVTVNGKNYLGRLVSSITLEKSLMDSLVESDNWLVAIETMDGESKKGHTYKVPGALQYADHVNKMPWLRLAEARKVIEEKAVEYHKSLYHK